MTRVLVVGVAVVDYVFFVDSFPTEGTKYRAKDSAIVGGGCAANAAVAIAKLSGEALLSARLGQDPVGDMIVNDLERDGEAAISELRSAGKAEEIGLVSVYLSHGVYRGLLRNKVLFAPTDKMVQQGRLSVMQAAHYLRGEEYDKHASPTIKPLTPNTLHDDTIEESLSPSEYRPTFRVKAVD